MCRAFDIPFKEALDTIIPTGIYTLPEVSMVGLTEEAARAASGDVATGRTYFSGNARARISGDGRSPEAGVPASDRRSSAPTSWARRRPNSSTSPRPCSTAAA